MTADKTAAFAKIYDLAQADHLDIDDITGYFIRRDTGEPAASKGTITRLLSYIGGIFIFMGLGGYIAMIWAGLSGTERILVTLGPGMIALIMGLAVLKDERYIRASTPLFLIAAFLQPVGLFVFLNETFSGNDASMAAITVFGPMMLQNLLLFWATKRTSLLFFTIMFAFNFFWALMYKIGFHEEEMTMILGLSGLLISHGINRTSHRAFVPFTYFIFALCFATGAFAMLQNFFPWDFALIGVAAAMIFASVRAQSRSFLVASILTMMGYIGYYTSEYFANYAGWPIALIVMGFLMIGLSAYAVKLTKESEPPKRPGRPFALDPLYRPLNALAGVGPKIAVLMEKLIGGPKILNLLWHLPIDFIDRRFSSSVADAPDGKIVTLSLRVQKHFPAPRKGLPYRVWCTDASGAINLVFFHAHKDWLEKQLPVNADVIVSGRIEYYQGKAQMTHPDAIGTPEDRAAIEIVEPIYPLTQGITNKVVRKAVQSALGFITKLPEWQDAEYKKRRGWADWDEAVQAVHNPESESGLSPLHSARARIAYDELLSNQLTLALIRNRQKKLNGRSFKTGGALREKVLKALPFKLTSAQERTLGEIDKDMAAPTRMLRLLQGDVGSGKTVVACLAMLNAVESGTQAAIMAPTEILARQHAESLRPWLDEIGIRYIVLTGRDKGKAREALLAQISSGKAQIVIGTHAIFQEGVDFADLGMAVIDEQHRFGVHQRLQLSSKGSSTDILVMTATPIPRTLALTAYGDMEVSKLDEKPPGRKPIDTLLIPSDKMDNMVDGIARQISTGARVYWVCPLEESEKIDLAAAEERYDVLKARFGNRVGLIHGRLKPMEKDAVMEKFSKGDLDILVATTVIEVGVNVPEATVMIIEHAERFGLSQLHQLRGRVGRGGDKSYCFLLYYGRLGETAKERLSIMRATEDGFLIAEKDLELRGGGDILGVRQSGLQEFKLADLAVHGELLAAAADDARLIINKDPELQTPRGQALRTLLYLFERDQAIQYLRSG